MAARRVEEICRAVADDRLGRRLSDLRTYQACLAVFAGPWKGWPAPVAIPGLSNAEVLSLADGLESLAGLIDSRSAAPAIDQARAVLGLIVKVQSA